MNKVIDIQSRLPKDSTVAIIEKKDQSLIAFLSVETTDKRYSFTQEEDKMNLVTAQEANDIVDDLYSNFENEGIRTFNEDDKVWSITPISKIEFVATPVVYEDSSK